MYTHTRHYAEFFLTALDCPSRYTFNFVMIYIHCYLLKGIDDFFGFFLNTICPSLQPFIKILASPLKRLPFLADITTIYFSSPCNRETIFMKYILIEYSIPHFENKITLKVKREHLFGFKYKLYPNLVKRTLHKERPYKICKHTALTYGHVAFG